MCWPEWMPQHRFLSHLDHSCQRCGVFVLQWLTCVPWLRRLPFPMPVCLCHVESSRRVHMFRCPASLSTHHHCAWSLHECPSPLSVKTTRRPKYSLSSVQSTCVSLRRYQQSRDAHLSGLSSNQQQRIPPCAESSLDLGSLSRNMYGNTK